MNIIKIVKRFHVKINCTDNTFYSAEFQILPHSVLLYLTN